MASKSREKIAPAPPKKEAPSPKSDAVGRSFSGSNWALQDFVWNAVFFFLPWLGAHPQCLYHLVN